MSVRCITFDLDDTLWPVKPVIERAERDFNNSLAENYPRIGEHYTPEEMLQARKTFKDAHPQFGYNFTQLRKHWLAHLFTEHNYPHDQIDAAFRVFWEARNQVTFYDEALAQLHCLAEDYTLGVISNGNADVNFIGIGHLFSFTVNAAEAGVPKPHPDIFALALDKAQVEPHECVHVGDDPRCDVLGALQHGVRAVWLNRDYKPWPGGQTPDAVIRRLCELPAIIEKW